MNDILEPLDAYNNELRDKFAKLTVEKFKELNQEANVDIEANRNTVKEIGLLNSSLEKTSMLKNFVTFLMCIFVILTIGFSIYTYILSPDSLGLNIFLSVLFGVLSALFIYFGVCLGEKITKLKEEIDRQMNEAWAQMAPLNNLFTWDITVALIEATVPKMAFDPFFSAKRLNEMEALFGWDGSFNNNARSILFAQSGEINGNPFLLGEFLEMAWGEEVYTNSITIYWTEYYYNSEGRRCSRSRSQVLEGSVTAPIPVYGTDKVLVYGNDAAPDLTFSREPSALSSAGEGWFAKIKKNKEIKKLQAKARNLNDASSKFTMMSNHEFEALFGATNRDNEVQFRLLYTPLAQIETLKLLKDKEIGFGDDFAFVKENKINMIFSEHLREAIINTDPNNFKNWNYDNLRDYFLEFNTKYFKDIFFTMAPLLAVPLYQHTKSHQTIYKDVITAPAGLWEHESIANYYGGDYFKHPNCITNNILKTEVISRDSDSTKVNVTAYGYRGEKRVSVVEVYGDDGEYHDINVHWIEYLPVDKTTTIAVKEGDKPNVSEENAASLLYRRSIYSYIFK